MKQTYSGGCQCGNVRYQVALDLAEPVMTCNCSRCGRLGSILAFAPAGEFTLQSGSDSLTEYRFNKKALEHLFCATCGIQSFARGTHPGTGAAMVAVNARCLDGVEPDTLTINKVDGRSF